MQIWVRQQREKFLSQDENFIDEDVPAYDIQGSSKFLILPDPSQSMNVAGLMFCSVRQY